MSFARTGVAAVDDALGDAVLELAVVDEGGEARVGCFNFDEEHGGVEEQEKVDIGTVAEDAEFGVWGRAAGSAWVTAGFRSIEL